MKYLKFKINSFINSLKKIFLTKKKTKKKSLHLLFLQIINYIKIDIKKKIYVLAYNIKTTFNLNVTKSDKVKTAFYSFNGKKSVCDWTPDDYDDHDRVRDRHKKIKAKNWRLLSSENFQNYQLEYVANIEYNSLILYPSHYWHSVYIKEDWFTDTDRVTFTGFFETKTTSSKTKKLGFG